MELEDLMPGDVVDYQENPRSKPITVTVIEITKSGRVK